MQKQARAIWVQAGYSCFAKTGPTGIKIEVLARSVGKSKSSFYHYFADTELFVQELLQEHLRRAKHIAQRMQSCQRMVPDMLQVLLGIREDIFFQRQLRIHRQEELFLSCAEQAHEPIEEAFLDIWAQALGLSSQTYIARIFLKLVVENFYLRLTEEAFSEQWLLSYLQEIQRMVRAMTQK